MKYVVYYILQPKMLKCSLKLNYSSRYSKTKEYPEKLNIRYLFSLDVLSGNYKNYLSASVSVRKKVCIVSLNRFYPSKAQYKTLLPIFLDNTFVSLRAMIFKKLHLQPIYSSGNILTWFYIPISTGLQFQPFK